MENSKSNFVNQDFRALQDLSREMRESYENHEAREKRLPATLYHVTKRSNLQQILKEGIDPSTLIFEDNDVVSLSDDISFAMQVAEQIKKLIQKIWQY